MSESGDDEPLVESWDAVRAEEELKVREDQLRGKEAKYDEKSNSGETAHTNRRERKAAQQEA